MLSKILKLVSVLFLSVATTQAQNVKPNQSGEPIATTSSTAKIFMVLDITVHDTAMYEQYRINVEPIIKKFGGKYLVRSGGMVFDKDPGTKVIPVEGNWNPDRLIIVQWNSIEALQKFAMSAEYRAIAKLRENSASTKSVIVKEYLN